MGSLLRIELAAIDSFHKEYPLSKNSNYPVDFILSEPEKSAVFFENKLGKNETIHGRKCKVMVVNKSDAQTFLLTYHLFEPLKAITYFGLYYFNELVAVASFSKGRKLNRLPEYLLSFELLNFCTKSHFTINGGLSKLIVHFCKQSAAGDVMTYVDASLSNGESFETAGFIHHSKTKSLYFLVNKTTHKRSKAFVKIPNAIPEDSYLIHNLGNWKMVFTPILKVKKP